MQKNNNFLYENETNIYDKYNTGEELFYDPYYQQYIYYMKTFTNSFLDESDFDVLSYVGHPFDFSDETYQTITYEHMKYKKSICSMNIDSDSITLYFSNLFYISTEMIDLKEDSDSLMNGLWDVYEARDENQNIKCVSILKSDFDYDDIEDLSVFKQEHNCSDIITISFDLKQPNIMDFSSIVGCDGDDEYIYSNNECLIHDSALHLFETQNEVTTVVLFFDMYRNIVGMSIFLEDEYFPY